MFILPSEAKTLQKKPMVPKALTWGLGFGKVWSMVFTLWTHLC